MINWHYCLYSLSESFVLFCFEAQGFSHGRAVPTWPLPWAAGTFQFRDGLRTQPAVVCLMWLFLSKMMCPMTEWSTAAPGRQGLPRSDGSQASPSLLCGNTKGFPQAGMVVCLALTNIRTAPWEAQEQHGRGGRKNVRGGGRRVVACSLVGTTQSVPT